MTNEEAIGLLKDELDNIPLFSKEYEAHEIAIDALEKQIKKTPVLHHDSLCIPDWGYMCPRCGNKELFSGDRFCECGQRLDWSEDND